MCGGALLACAPSSSKIPKKIPFLVKFGKSRRMRSIERDSRHWKIWRSTVSLKDDDGGDETKKRVRKSRRVRTTKYRRPRRTPRSDFRNDQEQQRTASEALSTFKSYKHSSQFPNASSVPVSTSSRQMKSSTSNTVVGPGTYNPSTTTPSASHSFPEPRFSSSELKSSLGASYYSIDMTRPQAPRCASVLHLEVHENVDESGVTMTPFYSSFRVTVRPIDSVRPLTVTTNQREYRSLRSARLCLIWMFRGGTRYMDNAWTGCVVNVCLKRPLGRIVVAPINRKPNPYFLVFYLQQSVET